MINGIGNAIEIGFTAICVVLLGVGVFIGWLLFWAIPTAWPTVKAWLHAVTS